MTLIAKARAPGKLVVAGDYAVLEGAPAISAAVDLYAEVTVSLANAATHQLHIVNSGYTFAFDGGFGIPMRWHQDPGAAGALLSAALQVFLDAGLTTAALPCVRISIDTRDFFAQGSKKGIGSSAAVAVALTGALGVLTRSKIGIDTALQVHRSFQHDQGSGIDVLTSWEGGVICMQPGDTPTMEPLDWPEGMFVRPVPTGRPASTPAMLMRLEDFRAAQPAEYAARFTVLKDGAAAVAAAWVGESIATQLSALQDYAIALQLLDDVAGIGIWSEEHCVLRKIANRTGVIYKPSGAGGGDFGLAFAADAGVLEAFSAEAQAEGFREDVPGWSEMGLTTQPLNL